MDVILLERVEKLGNIGDVVTVKPGYARNFLLPRAKALRASEANNQTPVQGRSEKWGCEVQPHGGSNGRWGFGLARPKSLSAAGAGVFLSPRPSRRQ